MYLEIADDTIVVEYDDDGADDSRKKRGPEIMRKISFKIK